MANAAHTIDGAIAALPGAAGLAPEAWACFAVLAVILIAGLLARPARHGAPAGEHLRFWRLLLQNSRQAIVIFEADGSDLCATGEGAAALADCRARPGIARQIDALVRDGVAFENGPEIIAGKRTVVRGMPVGRRAVLYFEEAPPASDGTAQREWRDTADACRDALRRLPAAVACFGVDRRLWAHSDAFARLWGLPRSFLDAHPREGEILERLREEGKLPEQQDFQGWKQRQLRACGGARESWHLPDGRSLRLDRQALAQNGKLILFEDISRQLALETAANLQQQVQKATLDTLDEAIAIFALDGRLTHHNAHFAALWHLGEEELASQPHYSQIATLCLARIGPDEVWNMIGESVNAVEPAARFTPRTIARADGRRLLLTLSRLPNRATIANFVDLTDLESFEAMRDEDRRDVPTHRR